MQNKRVLRQQCKLRLPKKSGQVKQVKPREKLDGAVCKTGSGTRTFVINEFVLPIPKRGARRGQSTVVCTLTAYFSQLFD